jgi:hypothetical protein
MSRASTSHLYAVTIRLASCVELPSPEVTDVLHPTCILTHHHASRT